MYFAQPFWESGGLVAAVRMILWHFVPFFVLIAIVLAGFEVAAYSFSYEDNFDSFPKALETLFYALIGDFDPDARLLIQGAVLR